MQASFLPSAPLIYNVINCVCAFITIFIIIKKLVYKRAMTWIIKKIIRYCKFTVKFLVVLWSKKGLIKYVVACLIYRYNYMFYIGGYWRNRVQKKLLHKKRIPYVHLGLYFSSSDSVKWGLALYMIITYTAELWLFILEKRLKLKQNQRFGFKMAHWVMISEFYTHTHTLLSSVFTYYFAPL